jgi:hypothetical protein
MHVTHIQPAVSSASAKPDRRRGITAVRPATRLTLTLLAILTLCGCATIHDWHAQRATARYCRKHPERPPAIHTALLAGNVCLGMTPEEVALCLGEPRRRDRPATPTDGSVWHYDELSSERNGLRGSALWDLRVPTWRIAFDQTGTVADIVRYHANAMPELAPAPEVARSTAAQPPPANAPAPRPRPGSPARPRRDAPRVTPVACAFEGWPLLTLTGVSAASDHATAIINDELVEAGEVIKGVRVLKIGINGVLLEYGGIPGFLAPGASTQPAP